MIYQTPKFTKKVPFVNHFFHPIILAFKRKVTYKNVWVQTVYNNIGLQRSIAEGHSALLSDTYILIDRDKTNYI